MRPLSVFLSAFLAFTSGLLVTSKALDARPSLVQAQEAKGIADAGAHGKVVEDLWDAAYLEGSRTGYVHTQVREMVRQDKKYYQTVMVLYLTVKRNQQVIELRMETGNVETDQGKVLATYNRQYLGSELQLEITGKVVGKETGHKELQRTMNKTKPLDPARWDDRVVGMYRQQRLLADRKVKPGDSFSYPSFEPAVSLVIANQVEVKDLEEVELEGSKSRRRLLRIETKPKKIQNTQLPTLITWVDNDYVPVRAQTEIPSLGTIVLYRTTRQAALAPASVARLTDIGVKQLVHVNKRIPQPYNTSAAVYRITIRDEDDPGNTFSRDQRQQVKNVKGQSFDLHVRAQRVDPQRGPQATEAAADKIGAEFTHSSYFINCADARVKQLAHQAVGPEKNAWKKAVRIEKWVHGHMTVRSDEALATADHVARTLRGDCTEFAMLTAAMCRAEGVPSKTAIGLIYANDPSGPVFAFHMWTEVWVNSQWIPLDATLGNGYVGATHLKITDHSWNDTRTLTPLLPLLRVLGRVSIEVVRAEE